jgi:2-(1,2-epoxy-1,2-dihydrophenyl)acetyl-CoA isomerase
MIHTEAKGDRPEVITIRIDRPQVRNALDAESLCQLADRLRDCQRNASLRAVIITGAGNAFCSGADINTLNSLSGEALSGYIETWTEVLTLIISMPKVVVAAVNGPSAGAGNHMMLCSDLCYMSARASFHFTGPSKGIPSMELGALLLPMTIGLKRAKGILLRGGEVGPALARDFGLCNEVVPHEAWESELDKLADELASRRADTLAHNKFVLNQAAFDMIGAVKLSALAGSTYLSGQTGLKTGRLSKSAS